MASKRDLIKLTDDEVAAFLAEQKTVIVASNGHRGWPHLMPLWFVTRPSGPGGAPELWGWTFAKSQKTKNLERDPRATLQVEDGEEYHLLRGVMLETEVVIHRELDVVAPLGIEIMGRYAPGGDLTDDARAAFRKQAEKRVGLQFVETRRTSWDHRKLGGAY